MLISLCLCLPLFPLYDYNAPGDPIPPPLEDDEEKQHDEETERAEGEGGDGDDAGPGTGTVPSHWRMKDAARRCFRMLRQLFALKPLWSEPQMKRVLYLQQHQGEGGGGGGGDNSNGNNGFDWNRIHLILKTNYFKFSNGPWYYLWCR